MIKENIEVGRDGYEKCEMNRLRTLCYLIKICIDKDLLCGNLQLKKVINSNTCNTCYCDTQHQGHGVSGAPGCCCRPSSIEIAFLVPLC